MVEERIKMSCISGMNWTKLVIALAFIYSIVSFGAIAQTSPNKPMDAKSLNALVAELKEGLADLIEDEEAVAAIVKKWDAHNLAGKTRTQILGVLFADVKSVVADKETLDSVWEGWKEVGLNDEDSGNEDEEDPPAKPATQPAKPAESPAQKPAEVTKFWIKLVHDGFYLANFYLTWNEPNKPNNSWSAEDKGKGFEQRIELPGNATNIRLKMENLTGLVWQPRRVIIDNVLQSNELNKCYRVHGTTLGSGWDNNCQ